MRRILLLFISALMMPFVIFGFSAVGYGGFDNRFFNDALILFPFVRVAIVATMLSTMWPDYIRGANIGLGGSSDHDYDSSLYMFLFTSFLILPLMWVFSPSDLAIAQHRLSREGFIWPFMLIWWAHGGINARYVALQYREQCEKKDEIARRLAKEHGWD